MYLVAIFCKSSNENNLEKKLFFFIIRTHSSAVEQFVMCRKCITIRQTDWQKLSSIKSKLEWLLNSQRIEKIGILFCDFILLVIGSIIDFRDRDSPKKNERCKFILWCDALFKNAKFCSTNFFQSYYVF